MKDHKCVKEGIVQFNLGSYTNPICTTKKVSDQSGRLGKVWDDHDLLFRYCYYPGACATADTDEKIFQGFITTSGVPPERHSVYVSQRHL